MRNIKILSKFKWRHWGILSTRTLKTAVDSSLFTRLFLNPVLGFRDPFFALNLLYVFGHFKDVVFEKEIAASRAPLWNSFIKHSHQTKPWWIVTKQGPTDESEPTKLGYRDESTSLQIRLCGGSSLTPRTFIIKLSSFFIQVRVERTINTSKRTVLTTSNPEQSCSLSFPVSPHSWEALQHQRPSRHPHPDPRCSQLLFLQWQFTRGEFSLRCDPSGEPRPLVCYWFQLDTAKVIGEQNIFSPSNKHQGKKKS